MSVTSYQRDVENRHQAISKLAQDKAREASRAVDETKRANSDSSYAARSTNSSTKQSYTRSSQNHFDAAARYQKNVADIEGKIAREQTKLHEAERRLHNAQSQDDQRRLREQERQAREHERRMSNIAGRLVQHDQLHSVALSAIDKLQRLPEKITVLFFAANPLDQKELRLDEEVRAIGEMIRKTERRDSVRLESRWAVRPLDVLQAINECNPRIVHFSGHGSDRDEIVFQDNEGQTKLVPKAAIAATLAAASGEIQLVFFNTCYSKGQAEAVVQHVPAAIGMNTSIGDEAARVFSAQFYSAIGFGLSVARAFAQAKAALMLEGIPEDSVPELFVTAGLSAEQLVLVQ